MKSKKFLTILLLLFLNLLAEKTASERVTAFQNTYRKMITFCLPIPITNELNDPHNTPHYRLMTELIKQTPHISTAKTIISQSSVEQIDDGELISPLMACAALGHNAIMELLLAKKVAINQLNRRHQTAVMIAAMANNTTGLIQLINAGARLDLKDKHEGTAQDYAKAHNHPHCIKIIQDAELAQRMQIN